jgi:hypothetical protein
VERDGCSLGGACAQGGGDRIFVSTIGSGSCMAMVVL